MSRKDHSSRRSGLGRLLGFAFGGPLLRIPVARTREGRRLRLAVSASVLFHTSLLAGGALLTATGDLRGGGTVAAIEVVLDTRGLATGPLADRDYAPPREAAERAPEDRAAETLDEDSLPTLAEDAPAPAEAPAPDDLPPDAAPTMLAALDAPAPAAEPAPADRPADTALPDVLETPRGIDNLSLPLPADAAPDQAPIALAPPAPEPAPVTEIEAETALPPAPPVAEPRETTPAALTSPPVLRAPQPAVPPAPSVAEAREATPAALTPPPVAQAPQPAVPPAPPQVAALTPPAPPPGAARPVDSATAPPLLTPPPAEAFAPAEPERSVAEPAEPEPEVPALVPPQVAAADEPSEPVEPDLPSPIDTLMATITPASLETAPPIAREDEALPPELGAPEPTQSPVPDPDQPPVEVASAAPPALYAPPPPAPAAVAPPPPAEEAPPPIAPVNWTQPFAPPAPDPRLVDPGTRTRMAEALDAEISAILSEISCGDLHADAGNDGLLSVRGYVTSAQQQAEIRNRLLGITDVRGVTDEGVVVIAEGLCNGLAVYSGGRAVVAPDPEPMDHLPPQLRLPPVFGMLQGAREQVVGQRQLDIHVETADFPAHVTIDYFRPDGSVVHLLPSPWNPDPYFSQPNTPIAIAAREGDISVLAGPPYGTGMVVTLSTTEPLFASLDERPLEENAGEYLARLEAILRDKERDPEFRAQYGYVFVDATREE